MNIWPPLLFLAIQLLALGVSLAKHGQESKGSKESFYSTLISVVLICALLWWGGFFAPLFRH